jgi:hypothetical protein
VGLEVRVGVGDGVGVNDKLGVGETVGLDVAVGVGVADGVGETEGLIDGVGEAVGVGRGLPVTDGVGVGLTVGPTVGDGVIIFTSDSKAKTAYPAETSIQLVVNASICTGELALTTVLFPTSPALFFPQVQTVLSVFRAIKLRLELDIFFQFVDNPICTGVRLSGALLPNIP